VFASPNFEITPQDVKRRLDTGEKLRLIDVREPSEVQQSSIAGAEAIPMRNVPKALGTLEDEENPIIVFCHHGMRSMQVVGWLRGTGRGKLLEHGGRN